MRDRELICRLEAQAAVGPDGIPALAAVPRADGRPGLRIWCRHCRRWHLHGMGYGHRVAHCADVDRRGRPVESPYRATGYRLAQAAAAGRPCKTA
ncbi:MAG: hypothetical protein NTX87_02420 [Planctomycetota bacterium]|nr:hypothetical protein [Planctomycetota bacterium]